MNDVTQAIEQGRALLEKYPEAVSAALIAVAVERRVVSQEQAEAFVRGYGLSDLEATKGALSRAVDRAGKRDELKALIKDGRRIVKRARALLDLAETARGRTG
jgi:hypothetical protein